MPKNRVLGNSFVETWAPRLFSSKRVDSQRRVFGWGYLGSALLFALAGAAFLIHYLSQ